MCITRISSLHLNLQNLKHFIQPGFRLQGFIVKFGLCESVSYMVCPGQQQGQTSRTPASDMKFTNWASFWECGVDLEISIPCPSMSLPPGTSSASNIATSAWDSPCALKAPGGETWALRGGADPAGFPDMIREGVGPLGSSLTNHQQKAKS